MFALLMLRLIFDAILIATSRTLILEFQSSSLLYLNKSPLSIFASLEKYADPHVNVILGSECGYDIDGSRTSSVPGLTLMEISTAKITALDDDALFKTIFPPSSSTSSSKDTKKETTHFPWLGVNSYSFMLR